MYRLSLAAALVIPTSSVHAQSVDHFFFADQTSVPSSFTTVADVLLQSVAGDFNGDLVADVATLTTGSIILNIDPGQYDSEHEVAGSYSAIVCVPASPTDLLVASDANGIAVLQIPADGTPAGFATVLTDTVWQNAKQVHSADLDGDGYSDILGVTSAGDGIAVLFGDGQGTWVSGTTTPWTGVLDIAAVDLADDGVPEVAVTTNAGLVVFAHGYDLNRSSGAMTVESQYTSLPAQGPLAVVRGAEPALGEQVTWPVLGASGWVHLLAAGPSYYGLITSMHNPGIVGLTTGRVSAGGGTDLLVSTQVHWRGELYEHVGTVDPSSQAPYVIPGGGHESIELLDTGDGDPAGNCQATPCLVDLDGDGDLDMWMGVQSNNTFRYARGNAKSASGKLVVEPTEAVSYYNDTNDEAKIQVEFEYDYPGSTATHAELIVWRASQVSSGNGDYETHYQAIHRDAILLDTPGGSNEWEFTLTSFGGYNHPHVYFLCTRLYLVEQGEVTRRFPMSNAALTFGFNVEADDYVASLLHTGSPFPVMEAGPDSGGEKPGEQTGCITPIGCIPLPPNLPPVEDPPASGN